MCFRRLTAAWEDKTNKSFKNDSVEVGHYEKAKGDGNNAEKRNMVIGMHAVSDVVTDLPIKDNAGAAGGEDDKANDEGAKIEPCPQTNKRIIHCISMR